MSWPPRFLFIGNRLCVDFVLTGGEGRRAHWERWGEPADLLDWYAASSLKLVLPRVSPRALRSARDLREAIWEGAQAVLRKAAPPTTVIRELERAAARPDLVPVWNSGRTAWAPDSTATQALSNVARDALLLFGSEAKDRLRECRNPDCSLLFVDTSRPGRRSWCAMGRCGNMQKTKRYRRKRAALRSTPQTPTAPPQERKS